MYRNLLKITRTSCINCLTSKSIVPLTLVRPYSQPLNLSEPAIQRYLGSLLVEYDQLLTKSKRTPIEVARINEIKPIVDVLDQRLQLHESIEFLKDLDKQESKSDKDVRDMIKEEAALYLKRLKEIDGELLQVLCEAKLTDGGVLVEVTAGAGGQEAMLFANELFNMYVAHAEYKDWEISIASMEESDIGGIRKASFLLQGVGVPELMKLEAGVHRVQRVPATEKGGRMHTSTVSVAVLPQPSEVELNILDKDLHIETKRASGAGGQHVNTTDSAVRITHLPSGIAVECQEGRSQIKNREIAMQKLRALLLQKQVDEQHSKVNAERRSQVGSGERNEKIRTYNYQQDRVTEHRPGGSTIHNLKGFLQGGEPLEQLQLAVLQQQRHQALMQEINQFVESQSKDQQSKK